MGRNEMFSQMIITSSKAPAGKPKACQELKVNLSQTETCPYERTTLCTTLAKHLTTMI